MTAGIHQELEALAVQVTPGAAAARTPARPKW